MKKDEQHERAMLTVGEVAEIFGVDHKTVRKEIAVGRIAHVKFGRASRVPRTIVMALAEGRPAQDA